MLGKVFTDSTHIVANKKSGHVYSMQAIQELNVKAKNWKVGRESSLHPWFDSSLSPSSDVADGLGTLQDLITDEPFSRKDLIQIQDPMNLAGKELSKFDHVLKDISVAQPAEAPFSNINVGVSARASPCTPRVASPLSREVW